MATIKFKRGDTFRRACTYVKAEPGLPAYPEDLTGCSIRTQMRDRSGTLIPGISASISAQSDYTFGQLTLDATPVSTAAWPLGVLYCDVEVTDAGGTVRSSQTFVIQILEDITR